MVFSSGFDGLLYSLGFMVGWPIVLFLIAERLRNLGKYNLSDVVSFRLEEKPVRTLAAISSLVVVAFYLIAQMVGAGQLIKLLFGLNYNIAVVIVGLLMMAYVMFGGMLATTGTDHQGCNAAFWRNFHGIYGNERCWLQLYCNV